MLPWWGWLLLWAVLVLGGALWVGIRVRAAWRSAAALGTELARAERLVAELEGRPEGEPVTAAGLVAATRDPRDVRAEYREQRVTAQATRRARREAARPPWARHVH